MINEEIYFSENCSDCEIGNEQSIAILNQSDSVFDAAVEYREFIQNCQKNCKKCNKEKNKMNDKNKSPIFGGAYTDASTGELVYIKEVLYTNPATVIFWSDGTKTVAKCHKEDKYSASLGVAIATLKKLAGNKFATRLLEDWGEPDSGTRKTVQDVRKKHKES